MNRYALTTTVMGYTVILQIVESEGAAPAIPANEPLPNGATSPVTTLRNRE